jgi:hypothetical protein
MSLVGLVNFVRQAKTTSDVVESNGDARVFESCAEFPYLEDSSHPLLVSPSVRALKKKFDPISLIFFWSPPWKKRQELQQPVGTRMLS